MHELPRLAFIVLVIALILTLFYVVKTEAQDPNTGTTVQYICTDPNTGEDIWYVEPVMDDRIVIMPQDAILESDLITPVTPTYFTTDSSDGGIIVWYDTYYSFHESGNVACNAASAQGMATIDNALLLNRLYEIGAGVSLCGTIFECE